MQIVFRALASAIIRRPVVVLAVSVLVTLVFGGFSSQAVNVQDVTAEENELTRALNTIDERFGDPTSVLQVVFEAEGDIRSVDSLTTSIAIEDAIRSSDVADTLIADGQQPAIAGFLGGAQQAVAMGGTDPSTLDDAEVRELQEQALAMLPPQVAGLFDSLLGTGETPTAGLLLVFQDAEGLDDDEVLAQQEALAEVVSAVDVPDGLTVDPFSFGLLLTGSDVGPEIGRLFGTALLIILLVLAIVYWIKPEAGQRRRIGRRTAADVGLTLAVIIMSVVWMQGLGVLLGPDYLDVIDYFSPQTQIVPILIVGLGVDFAIHLLARYRAEVGDSGDPERALRISMRTVGFTLMLVTGATAIGFLTNLSSPVSFLATLGVLAAVGIAAAFVLTLTFLPAIRLMLDRRATRLGRLPQGALASQTERGLPQVAGRTAWLAERVPVPTLVVALAFTALGGYGFTQLDSEFNLTDFVPQDEPLLETFDTLSTQFDGGFEESTQVLVTGDIATPDAHNALVSSIEAAADVPGVQTLAGQADANSIVSVLGQAFAQDLAPELAAAGVREDLTVADDADVDALYGLLLEQAPGADQVLAPTDDGWLTRVDLRTSAGQDGAAQLEVDLDEAFAPVEAAGASAIPASQQIAQAQQGEQIEDSQVLSLLIALGAAMALLVIHFTLSARRPALGVITVLPVGLVLALTFGTMALTGIPLNPVTATLAALSIGIGVPFTIHVTSRFLEERTVLYDGATALRRTVGQTGGALAGSALTTAIGFGVLTTSTLVPFSQLGFVIAYAIAYSLIASVLVLPSMLALWDAVDRARHGSPSAPKLSAAAELAQATQRGG